MGVEFTNINYINQNMNWASVKVSEVVQRADAQNIINLNEFEKKQEEKKVRPIEKIEKTSLTNKELKNKKELDVKV